MRKIVIVFFIIIIIYSGGSFRQNISGEKYLASIDYEGQLATSVGYLTIGWTVKKYDLPITDSRNVTFRCNLEKKYYIDDAGVVHTSFVFDEQELLNKIRSHYPWWADKLEKDGGSVYLDAVMTCTIYQNGVHNVLGSMDENGNLAGETYTTFDGIAGARYWANREMFRNRYDLEVTYKPVPSVSVPYTYHTDIIENEYTRYSGCDENGVFKAQMSISSADYDMDIAIPSGERLDWQTAGTYGAHKITYVKTHIKAYYPVKVNVSQILVWTDIRGNYRQEEIKYSQWYQVEREFNYCRIKDGVVYVPQKVIVGGEQIERNIADFSAEDKKIFVEWRFGDLNYPEYSEELDINLGYIYSSDNLRPELVRQDYTSQVEGLVGNFTGSSQALEVNGDCILNNEGYRYSPTLRNIEISGTADILPNARNGITQVDADIVYKEYHMYEEDGKSLYNIVQSNNLIGVYDVNVCTPIILNGSCVDNRAENQMLTPDSTKCELVLGCDFELETNMIGEFHSEYKGYGYKDYSKYAELVEANFSFPVKIGEAIIQPNTWIELTGFTVPENIQEGSGTITMRAKSINGEHSEYVTMSVELSGQIRNFNSNCDISGGQYLKKGEKLKFSFTTIGLANSVENLQIIPSFYGIIDGVRKPVDVYAINDNDYEKIVNFADFARLELVQSMDGKNFFEGELLVPADLIVVEAGSRLEEYRGMLIVNFDIQTKTTDNADLQPLSYTNLANSNYGYCNRWQKEGFVESELLKYGDIVIYNLRESIRQRYVIKGTH